MDVFVYGTLTDPERVGEVVDAYAFLGPAVLDGLHPVQGRYPTLAPGGETGGRLLRTDDLAALDAYEGVGAGLYVRASVPYASRPGREQAADGEVPEDVAVYVGDPDRLDVDESVDWPAASTPGVDDFASRVRAYVEREGVRVRPRS